MCVFFLEDKGVPTRNNSDIFAPAELGCNISGEKSSVQK